jgi:prefoldin subunit 5
VYTADAADEMDMLKSEADYLKKSLDAINARIDALEKKPTEES